MFINFEICRLANLPPMAVDSFATPTLRLCYLTSPLYFFCMIEYVKEFYAD